MANLTRLGKGATRKIHAAIEDLFDKAAARLLGPQAIIGKKIYISYQRELSLPGIFEAGSMEEYIKPDLDVLNSLVKVAASYIEAHKERTKARVMHEINGALAEAKHKGGMSRSDFRDLVNTKLADVWAEVTRNIHSIVDTELAHAKNVSVLDGILGVNLNAGIDDPVVYFVVVRDEYLCDECKRLHLMDDGKTPRLWKLSEVGHGYHKKGEDNPKIGGLHPHCRCTLVTLLPSYGFTKEGMVKYVKRGHLELPAQRGLARSEEDFGEPLEKMSIKNIPVGKPRQITPSNPMQSEFGEYNYDHLLSDDLKAMGLKLGVEHNIYNADAPNGEQPIHWLEANVYSEEPRFNHEQVKANLIRKPEEQWDEHDKRVYARATAPVRKLVGHAVGQVQNGVLKPHFNDGVTPSMRGHGMGKILYSAIFGHAHNVLGAHTVQGGFHSKQAGWVHESLSREHGMDYNAKNIPITTLPEELETRLKGYAGKRAKVAREPYRYTIKDELNPSKPKLPRRSLKR